ncbi:MAG: TPM domain-containing protein [Candidatus Methanoperedens sp.]|nr:TPM domain-containing protein [Candidatus Methanoperedens sp.]
MKTYILMLLILLFFSPVANAVNYPQLSSYVTDNANMIDQSYEAKITQLAGAIEKETTVQIAVVTIESLEGESMEMYAVKLFENAGIGKKDKDNGLLIIVAKQERDYRFEVGYGLEGTVTDSMKVNIGDRIIVPNFRNGDYGKGIYESMLVVQELLKGNPEVISQYSMLQTTPLNVQSIVSQQNESTNWIYLVGILAIIAIGIVVLSMRRRERALRPTPNHVSAVPVLKLDIRAANTIYDLQVLRGYSVLSNNDIKFGVRLTNNTNFVITDADVILDYTKNLFSMKDSEIQHLGNIIPNGKRTATYLLKPLGCIHNEQINALITYKDHTGKKQTLNMRPKEVHCVCPFLKEKPVSEGEYSRLAAGSEFVQEGISFKGISIDDLAKFMGETCRHMLHKVREYDIEGKKVIYLSGESVGEKAYYLLTAVIQEYKGLTQVLLRAYSDKKYGLNGFMNEMADSLRHLVGSVQNAKEIGIIENTQVINIIDSVVQRTSFGVDEGGKSQVNIRDSVVQRSKIGKE